MRLKKNQVNIVKRLVKSFDIHAKVYLYGSRVDDLLKGGDIDLLIISQCFSFKDKLKLKAELYSQLGEQKVDVLITKEETAPFVQLVLDTAILL
ncbi:MAG: nucleotidyltransferase domain-containing protein [Gammaproteobacteria bacterium]|nr:MAG: nucleotidyltransferase domain-containing protein [Gammaproteobacteria bacterium]